jgi:choline dehydrogenase-like flavoprotein
MTGQIDAGVCVVGAGAAGLTVAGELAARGIPTTLVERGGRRAGRRADRETALEDAGHTIGRPSRRRRFALGGAGRVWSGIALELDAVDFEKRPWLDHSGWPFDAAHLAPFSRRARDLLAVQEPPPAADAPALPDGLAVRAAGHSGVRFGKPAEVPPGVVLRLRAAVVRLVPAAGGRSIAHAEAVGDRGEPITLTARSFVLAAGGIEVPRLLLHSGVGSGPLGRFFADHPYLSIPIVLPPGCRPPGGPTAGGHGRPLERLVVTSEEARRAGLLGGAAFLRPYRDPAIWEGPGIDAWLDLAWALHYGDVPEGFPRTIARAARGVPGLARAVADRRRADPRWEVRVALEQAPDPSSRITLSDRRDALGIPLPRVEWRPGDRWRGTLERLLTGIAEAAARDGWGPLDVDGRLDLAGAVEAGAHHMGATRMHDDPEHGVVDADCRVHGTTNLYVAGPSVFPTYGYANPMLTIVALALRLAGHLGTHG